jgi:heme-degrading monooxygenase HmoA
MYIVAAQHSLLFAVAMAVVFLVTGVMTRHTLAQREDMAPLAVRVAVFAADQGQLDDYRDFIDDHLFPTLRTVPGYVGAFLGRDANSGQLISLSFWRSEGAAAAGEEAVGREIRSLPPGSAPKPFRIEKYVIQYRDLTGFTSTPQ